MATMTEAEARAMHTCPVCLEPKSAGAVVCWGACWRSRTGLKYTAMTTDQWLARYALSA